MAEEWSVGKAGDAYLVELLDDTLVDTTAFVDQMS